LLLLVIVAYLLATSRPNLPDALGLVVSEVRIGMSGAEVVSLLEKSEIARGSGYAFFQGETRDGQKFSGFWGTMNADPFPPSDQIVWAEIYIDDDAGRELFMLFGRGGAVSRLWLVSDSGWEELRFSLARGTGWRGRLSVEARRRPLD
jgi:hypothetical protein